MVTPWLSYVLAKRAHIFGPAHRAVVDPSLVVHAKLVMPGKRRQRAPGLVEDAIHPLRFAKAEPGGDTIGNNGVPRRREDPAAPTNGQAPRRP